MRQAESSKKQQKRLLKSLFSRSSDDLLNMALVHVSLVHNSTCGSTISFSSIRNNFTFLLLSLVGKDLNINGFEIKVCKVCYLAMMLYHPPMKKLKALEVLDELKIREVNRLKKFGDHFLTFFVCLQKGSLNFLILLNDKFLLHLQRVLEFLHLLPSLYRLVNCLDQILP